MTKFNDKDFNLIITALAVDNAKRGITWYNLADELGISRSYMSQIKNGERNFSLESLAKVCERLNFKISINISKDGVSYDIQDLSF